MYSCAAQYSWVCILFYLQWVSLTDKITHPIMFKLFSNMAGEKKVFFDSPSISGGHRQINRRKPYTFIECKVYVTWEPYKKWWNLLAFILGWTKRGSCVEKWFNFMGILTRKIRIILIRSVLIGYSPSQLLVFHKNVFLLVQGGHLSYGNLSPLFRKKKEGQSTPLEPAVSQVPLTQNTLCQSIIF